LNLLSSDKIKNFQKNDNVYIVQLYELKKKKNHKSNLPAAAIITARGRLKLLELCKHFKKDQIYKTNTDEILLNYIPEDEALKKLIQAYNLKAKVLTTFKNQ
jgi:hypothetical protein